MTNGIQLPNISGIWVGNAYGTHPATIYADFQQDGRRVTAQVRANTSGNVLQFAGEGRVDGTLNLVLTEKVAQDQEPTRLTIVSRTLADYSIEATWEASGGGGGVMSLSRYVFSIPTATTGPGRRPAQIESREVPLDPVRMTRADIEALLLEIVKLLPQHNGIMVTVVRDQKNVTRDQKKTTNFAQDFIARRDLPVAPTEVFIGAAQSEAGAQKMVTITLGKDSNLLRVTWHDPQWVIGASEVLADFLRQRSNSVLSFWRKWFAQANFALFVILLILLPDLTVYRRGLFAITAFALMIGHRFAILWLTRTVINLRPDAKPTTSAPLNVALALATSAIGGLLAILLYDLIKDLGWPFGAGSVVD